MRNLWIKQALASALLTFAQPALAQIQTQPIEIIEAAPPPVFSERAGFWPTEQQAPELLQLDQSTLNDRWNSVPGIQARESGSPTISIRGSAQADRVLKLFEGAGLNMADGIGGSDLLIPTEVLSQVSILKGPSSVFYGNSAMAGALDHRLRYFERAAIRGSVADENGEFGTRSVSLILPYQSKSETTRAQVSVFHENRPGNFRFDSTTTPQSGRRNQNASELSRITLGADTQRGRWHFATRLVGGKTIGETPGSLYFPFSSTFDTQGSLATLEASRAVGESNFVSLRLTDVRIRGVYDDNTASESSSTSSKTALNADVKSVMSSRVLARTFADISFHSLSATYIGGKTFHLNETDLGQSFEISLSPSWTLQPAYRYATRYGKVFKAIGLTHSLDSTTQFLTFGEGFRAPSLSDRYASYSTYQGNPSLQPEKSWAVETGAGFENGRRYGGFLEGNAGKASVYYMKFNDLVETQNNGPVFTKVNSGDARTYGAEASLAYGYKIWMLSVGYNYLDARNETTREPLRLAPKHQAVATVAQLIGPVLLEARETLWSSVFDRDPTSGSLRELPSWNTFDLTARTLALSDWEVRFGVMNLFNKSRELTIGYPEPQRRFFVNALRFF